MQTILHEPERIFFESVISQAIAPEAIHHVHYQYPVIMDGQNRRIDFAVIGGTKKLALELDGFRYHAESQISQSDFADQLQRQNCLILDNWTVLRFSWMDVSTRPDYCINMVRRSVIDDEILHPILAAKSIRPHLVQTEALNALSEARAVGAKRGLVVLPTGLGKTYLAAFDAAKFSGRILFVVHNNEILQQACSTFQRVMPDRSAGLFNGTQRDAKSHVVCANVYSLHRRNLKEFFTNHDFDYIIIDEFHHAAARSYRELLAYFNPMFTLGLTATPVRTDEQDVIALLDRNVVYSLDAGTAIERGFLVPFNYTAFRDDIDYSRIHHNGFRYDVADLNRALIIEKRDEAIYKRYVEDGKEKAIGFCVSIEHANRMAEYFTGRGIAAVSVHSLLPKLVRDRAISDFRDNRLAVVFVRDMFNEGVDFPDVRTLMFLRPTESRLIFMQQLGRGLRLSPRKGEVKVLDFIGNYRGAEHVYSYLARVAAPDQSVGPCNKPVFFFDNGCQVSFSEEAIKAIASVGVKVKTDIDIVKKVFAWAGKKSRLPSFADVVTMADMRVSDIYSVYGCWRQFVTRLRSLDDSWDTADIELPDIVNELTLDEIGEYLDEDRGLLESTLSAIRIVAHPLLVNLRIITSGNMAKPRKQTEVNAVATAIEVVARQSRELLDAMRVAIFVMSFEFGLESIVLQRPNDGSFASRNLESATHFRDTVRVGVESSECVAWLSSLIEHDDQEIAANSRLYNYLLAGHRVLSATATSYREILAQW